MPDPIFQIQDALAGRYSIKRELGKGGMATVYLARDVRHDRFVALKVMRPDLASSVGAERFLHELRITAQLRHPGIGVPTQARPIPRGACPERSRRARDDVQNQIWPIPAIRPAPPHGPFRGRGSSGYGVS